MEVIKRYLIIKRFQVKMEDQTLTFTFIPSQNLNTTTVKRFGFFDFFFSRPKPTRTKRMGEETTETKVWALESRWMSGN